MLKLFMKRASEVNGKMHLIVLLQYLLYRIHTYWKNHHAVVKFNNNSHSRCWFIGCNQLNCCLSPLVISFYAFINVIFIVYSLYYNHRRPLSAFTIKVWLLSIQCVGIAIKSMRMKRKKLHHWSNRLLSSSRKLFST